jgi:hypothetical protein
VIKGVGLRAVRARVGVRTGVRGLVAATGLGTSRYMCVWEGKDWKGDKKPTHRGLSHAEEDPF